MSEFSPQNGFTYKFVGLLFALWSWGVDIYCKRKPNFRITKRLCAPSNHAGVSGNGFLTLGTGTGIAQPIPKFWERE